MLGKTRAFHGKPALREGITFSNIGNEWEEKTGLPEWFGWLVSHLLGRVQSQISAMRKPQLNASAEVQRLTDIILNTIPTGADLGPVKLQLWLWLLRDVLPQNLKDIEDLRNTPKILRRTARLRKVKDSGSRVPSQDWNDLQEAIENAYHSVHTVADRKAITNQEREQRRCLMYTLSATRYAAQKNTHEALANAYREAMNAMSCHAENTHAIVTQTVLEKLLKLLAEASPPVKKTRKRKS